MKSAPYFGPAGDQTLNLPVVKLHRSKCHRLYPLDHMQHLFVIYSVGLSALTVTVNRPTNQPEMLILGFGLLSMCNMRTVEHNERYLNGKI